ncbi:MAG: hypothetical protein M3094_00505 [Actinomycetia bacterium]|nr:hypothetical protein [Actinomycetes bacterium]
MVRKLFAVAIVALSLMSLASAALAAPPTMNLSSWEPVVENGAIVGGTQTVTITNITSNTMGDVTFSLATAPCDCLITESNASNGGVEGDAWVVGQLAPGATATLTLSYSEASLATASTSSDVPPITPGAELAVFGLIVAAGTVLGYRRRLIPEIA